MRIGKHAGRVIEVPGHTLDHIALILDADQVVFVGDTLFAMGCGRLFEGSAEQMFAILVEPGDVGEIALRDVMRSTVRFG